MVLPDPLQLSGCIVEFEARVARWADGSRTLTPTEVRLLSYLVQQDGRVVSKRELLQQVWGYRGGVMSRTVKTTMGRLRAKIEREPRAPDHLLTLVGSGYRFEALAEMSPLPPAGSEETTPAPFVDICHLPPGPNELIGRNSEVDAVVRTLGEERNHLVLLGPGGIGKTAVALTAARRLAGSGPFTEVRFCDLAPCRTRGAVLRCIAAAMGLEHVSDAEDMAKERLVAGLRARKHMLMILDGAEGTTDTIEALLQDLPPGKAGPTLLMTSRHRLTGDHGEAIEIEPLANAPSVELFLLRAGEAALPTYDETEQLAPILDRLDGLPLAIELAASWATFLPPDVLATRLDAQMHLLGSEKGGLRAAISSSWELLSPDEQAAVAQLAVFAGATCLTGAEAVVKLPSGAPVLPTLRRLCDRYLARRLGPRSSSQGAPVRITLYEAVRQFALELSPQPDAAVRHARWFASFGSEENIRRLDQRGARSRLADLEASRADLEASVERSLDAGHGNTAAGALRALLALTRLHGPLLAYEDHIDRVLAGTLAAEDRIRLLVIRCQALIEATRLETADEFLGRLESCMENLLDADLTIQVLCLRASHQLRTDVAHGVKTAGKALAQAEEQKDTRWLAAASALLGALLRASGAGDRGVELLERSLEWARAAGDLRVEVHVLDHLGRHALDRGRPVRALSLLRAALSGAQELGARSQEASILQQIALLEAMHEQRENSQRAFESALAVARELGDLGGEGRTAGNLGAAQLLWGDAIGARGSLERALQVGLELGDRRLEAMARGNLGRLFLVRGRHRNATAQLDAALELCSTLGVARMSGVFGGWRGELCFADDELDTARHRMTAALDQLRAGGWRRDAHELLLAWSGWEADAGNGERAETLANEAHAESEVSMADGPATWVGT